MTDFIDSFWGVFWVDVGTKEDAKSGFALIAKAFGWPGENPVDEFLQALSNKEEHWLLILDNADDVNFDYSQYIPSGSHGAIIVTSRNEECSTYSTPAKNAMPLLELESDHAKQLLLKAAHIREEEWLSREKEAQDIVDLLGLHTLGLIQAGAYVAHGFCRLDQFCAEFQKGRKRMLQTHPKQTSSRYKNVFATFEVSAEGLEASQDEGDQDAFELLTVLAMLHSSVLRLDIFEHAWAGARCAKRSNSTQEMNEQDELSLTPWHISQLPKFISVEAETWDHFRLKTAIARLVSLSLVTRHLIFDADGLSMHPLAHAWAKERLRIEQHRRAWMTTGCVLSFSKSQELGILWWPEHLRELRPHVVSFLSLNVQEVHSFGRSNAMLAVVVQCGWILMEMGEFRRVEELLRNIYKALGISPSAPSAEHTRLWQLASFSLIRSCQYQEAVKLFELILEVNATTSEKISESRLQMQYHLIAAYFKTGQITEAIELVEGILDVSENVSHYASLVSLVTQFHVVHVFCQNEQAIEATKLLQDIISEKMILRNLGDPTRLLPQGALFSVYFNSGRKAEAIKILEDVDSALGKTRGKAHPDRLRAQLGLAGAYYSIGQEQKGRELFEYVVERLRICLPQGHEDLQVAELVLPIIRM